MEINKEARSNKPWYKKWWGIALIIFAVVFVLGLLAPSPDDAGRNTVPVVQDNTAMPVGVKPAQAKIETPKEPENDPAITKVEFAAVKSGMSKKEVQKIIGSEGSLLSETDVAGYHSEIIEWKAKSGFGNANFTFSNGKLISKAQFGLE